MSKPPLDFSVVLDHCGGNARFAWAVVGQFRRTAVEEMDKIATALARADANAVRRAAHTSKSMAGSVAADAAAELARKIEDLGRAEQLQSVGLLLEDLRCEVNSVIAWIDQNGVPVGVDAGKLS